MRFTIKKKELLNALNIIKYAINKKSTSGIVLKHVLIEVYEKCIEITGTDLNHTIIVKVPAIVSEQGKLLVDYKDFTDIIKNLGDNGIEIEATDDRVLIKQYDNVIGLGYMDWALFPEVYKVDGDCYDICLSDLQDGIKKVIDNVGKDEQCCVWCNILFKLNNNNITLAATDTKRIVDTIIKTGSSFPEADLLINPQILKPIQTLKINEGAIKMRFDDRRVMFYTRDYCFVTTQVEGKYPTYTVAFEKQPDKHCSNIPKEAILKALSLLKDEYVHVNINKNSICVTDPERQTISKITCLYDGNEAKIVFTRKLLHDIIKNVDSRVVVIGFIDPLNPVYIIDPTTKGQGTRRIIMTVRG